jgi:hypothetical protein
MAKTTPTRGDLTRPDWPPRSVFPFQPRFTEIDGKQVHYIDEGSGPALLLVSAGQWSFMFRFQQIFPHATAAGIDDGHHFPFSDNPDAYAAAISAWWTEKVATDAGTSTNP